jgi:uncharacterized protein YjbI with pentapeptide repeats
MDKIVVLIVLSVMFLGFSAFATERQAMTKQEILVVIKEIQEGNVEYFYNENLEGADFSDLDLRGADFSHANLKNTNFYQSNLQDACFIGADLTSANLMNANLCGAKFNGAILSRCRMLGANHDCDKTPCGKKTILVQ